MDGDKSRSRAWALVAVHAACGIDIGGTLAKLAYISQDDEPIEETDSDQTDVHLTQQDPPLVGRKVFLSIPLTGGRTLRFGYSDTSKIQELVTFINGNNLTEGERLRYPLTALSYVAGLTERGDSSNPPSCQTGSSVQTSSQCEQHGKVEGKEADGGTGFSKSSETQPSCLPTPVWQKGGGSGDGQIGSEKPTADECREGRSESTVWEDRNSGNSGDCVLHVTGGGAYKYSEELKNRINGEVVLSRHDEMSTIMRGLSFLMEQTDSIFKYDVDEKQCIPIVFTQQVIYPFLVVNIGSGVSILLVSGPDKFVRVTGTCIGGGTALGLAKLLFGAKSFEEVLELAELGTDVLDLKVDDLFGDAAGSSCLPGNTLAASFGRVYMKDVKGTGPERRDMARSLIHMVSYNLGYLAYLVGTAHCVSRLVFAGKYISNSPVVMESITMGVHFYIKQYHLGNRGRRLSILSSTSSTCSPAKEEPDTSAGLPTVCSSPYQPSPLLHEVCVGDTTSLVTDRNHDPLRRGTPSEAFGPEDESRMFEVLFVKHDGYLGALGSLLFSADESFNLQRK